MHIILKIVKAVFIFIVVILLSLGTYLTFVDWIIPTLAVNKFEKTNVIPMFAKVPTDFSHAYTDTDTFPKVDAVALDRRGDGNIEIFVTGGAGQDNALLSYQDGSMINSITDSGLSQIPEATYGLEIADMDNDGDTDIITAQHNGVFLYTNNNGTFTPKQIPVALEELTVPLDVSAGDVDNDGYPELYVNTFRDKTVFKPATFNEEENKSANFYLYNNGDGTFSDQTDTAGLTYRQNVFLSRFKDLNEDGYVDLMLAPNTDRALIYENKKDGTFTAHAVTDFGFWMGIATSDIDNDGDTDIFLSNVGNTLPGFLTNGDANEEQKPVDTDWKMLRNDGNFVFTDITKETGTDGNVFAWGSEFADFNNDGLDDLVVTENFFGLASLMYKFYRNPGKLYIQGEDGTFTHTERKSGVANPFFGYTPLPVNLDNDDYMDLVIVNQGGPLQVFRNNGQ
jgi:hypothetical protein